MNNLNLQRKVNGTTHCHHYIDNLALKSISSSKLVVLLNQLHHRLIFIACKECALDLYYLKLQQRTPITIELNLTCHMITRTRTRMLLKLELSSTCKGVNDLLLNLMSSKKSYVYKSKFF